MRIVQVVTQREPAGAQVVADLLHRAWRTRGHDGDVWFLYGKRAAFEDADYRDLADRRPGAVGTWVLVARLIRWLRLSSPDVVVAHTHHAVVLATIAARVAGVGTRIAVHHTVGWSEGRLRRAIIGALRRTGWFTSEVFVSETTWLTHGAPEGGIIIHNGIDLSESTADGWPGDPRPADRPLVVAVGRLEAQKDHETLVRAIGAVPGVHLAIIGEGDLRRELALTAKRAGAGDRVHLVGNLPSDQVRAALAAAIVVCLPSVWEAFSIVDLETMAAGAPALVSDIPAHRESFADTVRYHPVGDVDSLAHQLAALIADCGERRRLGTAARTRSKRFSADAMADAYLSLMRPGD